MYMGANGFVCMGALGRRGTGGHKNKTNIDKNGLAGLGFRYMYAREISRKIHTCAVRHKGVMRDSGGWK